MSFVGILLALLIERGLGHVPGWGEPVIYPNLVARLQRYVAIPALWRSYAAPFVLLLPPVWAVWYFHQQIPNPFGELAFSTVALLLCLGPRDLADDVQRLLDARERGDAQTVSQLSRVLMRGPEPEPTHRSLLGALFIQSHERLFGVLMWFFVLGPAGAVMYRLASRLPRILRENLPQMVGTPALQSADALHSMLAWIPARLTSLLYAFVGSFDDAWREYNRLRVEPHEWHSHTWAILAEVPSASLMEEEADGSTAVPPNLEATLTEVMKMQRRALMTLLAFCVVFVFGSFTGAGIA